MRTQFSKLALTAGLMLAITFTFSCSSPDDDNGGGNSNNSNGGSSSPSGGGDSGVVPSPCPNATTGNGTMSCGGQTYGTVVIGSQTWMAKNLNYKVTGSKCYGNAESYCNKYGRLYDWETARLVCPSGWHLPSEFDWGELESYVESDNGCRSCAGKHLKSKSGWNSSGKGADGNGADTYGFSALPGGYGNGSSGGFDHIGDDGYWWVATEYSAGSPRYRDMGHIYEEVLSYNGDLTFLFSVRCVQD